MNAYVIKSWYAEADSPDGDGNYVRITGRSGGLISWLLALMKISPTVSLAVGRERIIFEQGSLAGSFQYQTPLENVCTTYYGYTKPWKEAIVVGIIVGLATFFLLFIPGIVAGLLYYFLNKTLTVAYTDMGGWPARITFKRSVIEGQQIDEEAGAKVCRIIQQLINKKTLSGLGSVQAVAPTGRELGPALERPVVAPSSGGRNFYYADAGGAVKGPVGFEELARLESTGGISDETKVIVEGASEWGSWGAVKAQGGR